MRCYRLRMYPHERIYSPSLRQNYQHLQKKMVQTTIQENKNRAGCVTIKTYGGN